MNTGVETAQAAPGGYRFGSFVPAGSLDAAATAALVAEARRRAPALYATPLARILDVLDALGEKFRPGQPAWTAARAALVEEDTLSLPMIDQSLAIIPGLFARATLVERIENELGDARLLDEFVARPGAAFRTRAVPHGVVLHVTAGNVFLGLVDSLIGALVTKNVSIVKLSSRNVAFPLVLARAFAEADPERVLADKLALVHWPGGERAVEVALAGAVDGVIAWGGHDMVKSYRALLPPGTPLLEHGPKISFQVVTRAALAADSLPRVAAAIAREIVVWDQAACASPQNLFVERGADVGALMAAVGAALEGEPIPRGTLDEDEEVEILKERQRGKLTSLTEGGRLLEGKNWLLHHDPQPGMRPSPLNRSLVLKSFADVADLEAQLAGYGKVLQSCSLLATGALREELCSRLAASGVQRFTPLGSVLDGATGAPHDGRFALSELVRYVGDEHARADVLAFAQAAIAAVPFYRERYRGRRVESFADLVPITAADLAAHALPGSRDLLAPGEPGGSIFASGGTTGNPKFAFFTHEELSRVGELLARGYRAQGVARGDVCANLFVAGNLWSSFLAVDRALAHLDAVSLPIGGLAAPDLILDYLATFVPRVVFGLPSLLAELARRSQAQGRKLTIPLVSYAGEHLNRQARALFREAWSTERCFSAGYATVDAGPIGYQCAHARDREHHLLEDSVHLEIEGGEAVVTSLVRRAMPIVHLRTGDEVEWSSAPGERCACGSADRRFVLAGRIDGQINLWASRIRAEEIERGLAAAGVREAIFQIVVEDDALTISIEGDIADADADADGRTETRARAIYESCADLRATHPYDFVRGKLSVRVVPRGGLARVARTGKIRLVDDRRRL